MEIVLYLYNIKKKMLQPSRFEAGELIVGREEQHTSCRLWYGVITGRRLHAGN
jgi:hypothetical protein